MEKVLTAALVNSPKISNAKSTRIRRRKHRLLGTIFCPIWVTDLGQTGVQEMGVSLKVAKGKEITAFRLESGAFVECKTN